MPIPNITNGESGASVRTKLNDTIDLVNAAPTTYEPISNQLAIAASDIDWDVTHSFKTLAANTVFTFSNAADARTITVAIINTVGNYTVTWPAGIKWVGGVAPTQTIGAKTDIYTFTQMNSIIYGTAVQNLS